MLHFLLKTSEITWTKPQKKLSWKIRKRLQFCWQLILFVPKNTLRVWIGTYIFSYFFSWTTTKQEFNKKKLLIYFISTLYFRKRAYITCNAHHRKCRTFFLHQTEFFFVMMMSQVVFALAIFFIQITHTARQYRGPEIVKKN